MENQVKIKVFCKAQTNAKYHLASFNAPLTKDSNLPRHIIEQVVAVSALYIWNNLWINGYLIETTINYRMIK